MLIPDEMLEKHRVYRTKGDWVAPDEVVYSLFLHETDYIDNKVNEGECTWDDYPEEKSYRHIARMELERLEREKNED